MKRFVERHWWALRGAWTEYRSEVRYLKNVAQK